MTVTALLAAIGALLAFIGGVFLRGRQAGKNDVIAEQAKQKEVIRDEYARIDAATPDLDGALDRLRKRAGSDSGPKAE